MNETKMSDSKKRKRSPPAAFGQKNDTQARFDEEDLQYKEKWQKSYEDGTLVVGQISRQNYKTTGLKNRRAILVDGQILVVETCVTCFKEKPLTPAYYMRTSGYDNTLQKSGHENMRTGCRICKAKKSKMVFSNTDCYVRNLLANYKNLSLKWYTGLSKRCSISNIEPVEIPNANWRASIQNNGPTQEHFEEHCTKICYEFNVAQHKAIPDLLSAWKECFQEFLSELRQSTDTAELVSEFQKWWSNTPKENGVLAPSTIWVQNKSKISPLYYKQREINHLIAILTIKRNTYRKHDKVSKRDPATAGSCLTGEQMFLKIIEQKCRCFYTGIPFSRDRDNWRHFSLERLDNSKNHTVENTVVVCRMFNTPGQLNRRKILTALLSQIHVPLTEEDRVMVAAQLLC